LKILGGSKSYGSFEISSKDVLGRVGRLITKSGAIETPHLFPVVNPLIQPITPKEIRETLRCNALMTNAYLLKKNFGKAVTRDGVHKFLDFDGIVATDSGAYQILSYGKIETDPLDIARFEEMIGSDIAVILDVPTGFERDKKHARFTVDETVRRADLTLENLTRGDIVWEGPVQGGIHLDLIAESARIMAKKPFAVYALGSPTQIMEHYMFDKLVDMIITAKKHLPIEKPLHLFGAGHPFMFSLAVLLGCDLFDSAAYAIAARREKYLTETGTLSLQAMQHFPCACPLCSSKEPKEVLSYDKPVRQKFLAEHNLRVCLSEIARIKQALRDGRLWELVEVRVRSHPMLARAFRKLFEHRSFLEKHAPSTKSRGLFYLGSTGLARPEVTKHQFRISKNYRRPSRAFTLLLLPQTNEKPYHESSLFREIANSLGRDDRIHICFYAAPYGIIPSELDDYYPLSQTELAFPLDEETKMYVVERIVDYILRMDYRNTVLLADTATWGKELIKKCRQTRKFGKHVTVVVRDNEASDKLVARSILKRLQGTRTAI
jgi:7-cyano-7-deazaguanine tRNA-ribosyltransferase